MISIRRTHIAALGAVVAGALAFGSPADAMAGTASVWDGVVTYEAATGESNRVTITEVDSRTVQIRDTAPVLASTGCFRTELHVARCTGDLRYSTVDLGDKDNELIQEGRTRDGSGVELYAVGGDGRDVFHVRSGWLWAMGAGGDDEFHGGSYADTFIGDTYGGSAVGRDALYGNGGNDALIGDSGADQIRGGSGRDDIDAGAGSDRVAAADDEADTVKCGDGYDEATLDGGRLDSSLGCDARTYL